MKNIFVLVHGIMDIQETRSDTDFHYYAEAKDAIANMDAYVSSYVSDGYKLEGPIRNHRTYLRNELFDSKLFVAVYCIDDYVEGTSYNWIRFQQETGFPYDYYIKPDEDMYRIKRTLLDRHVMHEVFNIREKDKQTFVLINDIEDMAFRLSNGMPFVVDMPESFTCFSPIAQIK